MYRDKGLCNYNPNGYSLKNLNLITTSKDKRSKTIGLVKLKILVGNKTRLKLGTR